MRELSPHRAITVRSGSIRPRGRPVLRFQRSGRRGPSPVRGPSGHLCLLYQKAAASQRLHALFTGVRGRLILGISCRWVLRSSPKGPSPFEGYTPLGLHRIMHLEDTRCPWGGYDARGSRPRSREEGAVDEMTMSACPRWAGLARPPRNLGCRARTPTTPEHGLRQSPQEEDG